MSKPRLRRLLFSAGPRPVAAQNISKEERDLLPQLLKLLRSGALTSLLQDHALAVLSPSNITGVGEEVHVLVEDPSGRWQTRRRFMLQLGTSPVAYMEGKPRKSVIADSVNVVLTYAKHHTDGEAWESAVKNAQELTKKWLKLRAKVDFLDVQQPTRIAGATSALQVIVFLPVSASTAVLRASGLDEIFVRQFIENDRDRAIYKAVPMPVDVKLATCIGQAALL